MSTFKYLLNQVPLQTETIIAESFELLEGPHGFALVFYDDDGEQIGSVDAGCWVNVWKTEELKIKATKSPLEEALSGGKLFDFRDVDFSQLSKTFNVKDMTEVLKTFTEAIKKD